MSRFNFWPKCEPGGLDEQDGVLDVVSFEEIPFDELEELEELEEVDGPDPTSLAVCRWCNGPASPALDDCCARCLEKLKRRAVMCERGAPNNSRIDFY